MLHLVIDIKQFIEGIKEHLGPIALVQNVLIPQSATLHGGCLEAHNAIGPAFPLLLCSQGECPLHSPFEYSFKPTGDNQQTLIQALGSAVTLKCNKQGHARMHPTCPSLQTMCHGYLQ